MPDKPICAGRPLAAAWRAYGILLHDHGSEGRRGCGKRSFAVVIGVAEAGERGSERGVSAEEGREKKEEDWKREGNGGF